MGGTLFQSKSNLNSVRELSPPSPMHARTVFPGCTIFLTDPLESWGERGGGGGGRGAGNRIQQ